jgi:hypothetical protein
MTAAKASRLGTRVEPVADANRFIVILRDCLLFRALVLALLPADHIGSDEIDL